jgi:hypothetical protein
MEDSSFGRVWGVLVSPTETFQSIAARPTIAVVLLTLIVLSTLSLVVALQKVDMAELTRQQMAASGREMTEEQMEQGVAFMAKFGPAMMIGSALVVAPLIYLLFAAAIMVALRLLGGEIGYKASLSVLLHGWMPWVVAALLTIVVVLGKSEVSGEDLQGGNLLASSAAAFASEETAKWLKVLLSALDVFTVWSIALMSIGYATAARVSRGTAAVTLTLLWAILVAGRVALATLAG